uniref:Uncharacterized protein n=1 Tax=Arundo donax TaxID=35708 RepID=A0A0A9HR54_ARUDO
MVPAVVGPTPELPRWLVPWPSHGKGRWRAWVAAAGLSRPSHRTTLSRQWDRRRGAPRGADDRSRGRTPAVAMGPRNPNPRVRALGA